MKLENFSAAGAVVKAVRVPLKVELEEPGFELGAFGVGQAG